MDHWNWGLYWAIVCPMWVLMFVAGFAYGNWRTKQRGRKPVPQVCTCGDSVRSAIGTCPQPGDREYASCPRRRRSKLRSLW